MLFRSIVQTSIPAKAYLAKQAFDRHDFTDARRLTGELVQLAPEDLQFRANLAAIDKLLARK